jgi:hypothetical protein
MEDDLIAVLGPDLGDAAAHQTGPDNHYLL